jgi:hypothetical protein
MHWDLQYVSSLIDQVHVTALLLVAFPAILAEDFDNFFA